MGVLSLVHTHCSDLTYVRVESTGTAVYTTVPAWYHPSGIYPGSHAAVHAAY
jgi:hypothetical protein